MSPELLSAARIYLATCVAISGTPRLPVSSFSTPGGVNTQAKEVKDMEMRRNVNGDLDGTDSPEEETLPVDVETFDSVIAALSVTVRPGAPAATIIRRNRALRSLC